MAQKITNTGKAVLGIAIIGVFFLAKTFWWDKRPHTVQEAQTYGKVTIPDAPDASLSGKAAVKLELPSKTPSNKGKVKGTILEMAWQGGGNTIGLANGGVQTTQGSLFDLSDFDITLTRQDNCMLSNADIVKFCQAYKTDPTTPFVMGVYMASGTPFMLYGMQEACKALGPEYQPVGFAVSGKSAGEDQIIGDKKYKDNKNLLKGALLVGVRMDGDIDLGLKLTGDYQIKVNPDETTFDEDALNLMYSDSYLDAVVKYNAGTTTTRHIVKNGKTTGRDTTLAPNLVATWTPGDVNAHSGKGGVTIISTDDYKSIMPGVVITCKKWLYDHPDAAKAFIADIAMAGDQIRSFEDTKKYACSIAAEVFNENDTKYWYTYYNGVKIDKDTRLGGSAAYNLSDMANQLGLGENSKNDILKSVYNTFGELQSKYYPKDFPKVVPYAQAFDKTFTQSVINDKPELLEGKASLPDYTKIEANLDESGNITNSVGNKKYSIEFASGKADILPSSDDELASILQDVTTADGTKVQLSGHTDNTGNSDANQQLSEDRAIAVANYLKRKGVTSERITKPVGYGDTKPVTTNATAAGKAKNRRVEVVLIGQ